RSWKMRLFDGQDADGEGPEFSIPISNAFKSQKYTLFVAGELDGGTLSLELSPDNGATWLALADLEITAAGAYPVEFKATGVRASLLGSTAPNVDAWLL